MDNYTEEEQQMIADYVNFERALKARGTAIKEMDVLIRFQELLHQIGYEKFSLPMLSKACRGLLEHDDLNDWGEVKDLWDTTTEMIEEK